MSEQNVIRLGVHRSERVFPRRLFLCNECECRTFKIFEADECVHIECANCEAQIDFEDVMELPE